MDDIIAPDPRILRFIGKHHVLSLATVNDNSAWCCSCFYAYIPDNVSFVFTSDAGTQHAREMLKNHRVAANIVLETKIIGKIQGLQISGTASKATENELKTLRAAYLKKFPYALPFLGNTDFWKLLPDSMKFTDNRLGFGVKLQWKRH